tara:strand:- start:81 stop:518 length:438 start_codon:yes stop_codon:yes gene_type:complete
MIIIRQDNFIEKDECDFFINLFNNNIDKTEIFRDTITLRFIDNYIIKKVKENFKLYNFDVEKIDTMQIVKWPTGSKMGLHKDHEGDKFSFIIYLNDDFEGGETIIDGVLIKPKKSRLVLFSNRLYEHEVKTITKGDRYTLIAWYK